MNQQKALQELHSKLSGFHAWEGEWIDNLVRDQYPKWVIWCAELSMRPAFGFIHTILARFSGLEIIRNQKIEKNKSFGKGAVRIVSITTQVFRRSFFEMALNTADILLTKLRLRQGKFRKGSLLAERAFPVNIIIRGELDEVLKQISKSF